MPDEFEAREWAFPAFGIPKKNGSIRLVIDFHRLNTELVRREYPLSTTEEILTSIRGFLYFKSRPQHGLLIDPTQHCDTQHSDDSYAFRCVRMSNVTYGCHASDGYLPSSDGACLRRHGGSTPISLCRRHTTFSTSREARSKIIWKFSMRYFNF